MMEVKEIELNDKGEVVRMKGTYKRNKIKVSKTRNIIFSKITDKTIMWAELGIEYIGG